MYIYIYMSLLHHLRPGLGGVGLQTAYEVRLRTVHSLHQVLQGLPEAAGDRLRLAPAAALLRLQLALNPLPDLLMSEDR